MKRYTNHIIIFLAAFLLGSPVFTSCEDIDEVSELNLDRILSPVNLSIKISNKTNAILTWDLSNKADQYVIELYTGKTIEEGVTPTKTYTIDSDEVPYTISGLFGETDYTVRIKGILSDGSKGDSKWSSRTFKTDAEQIFYEVANEDIEATQVTLRWPAGQFAQTIVVTPGDITHTVTAEEIAAGAALITGLNSETTYTAKLMNDGKTRGTATFKTAIDFEGKIPVYEGEDLVAALDAADDGANLVLVSGSFELGSYELKKSVTINGFDKGNMPTIYGRLLPAAGASSITLNNVIFRGDALSGAVDNFIELKADANISTLTVSGCEIRNYTKHIIYSNVVATLTTVLFENNWVDNFIGNGGDGFDIRKGTLGTLTIQNSTFSNGGRTFIRCNLTSATINVTNCTFYKVCIVDDSGNNSGLFLMDKVSASSGNLTVQKCVFSNIGVAALGYWAKAGKMKATTSYDKNFYYSSPNLWDVTNGFYKDPSACSATEVNPKFANPDSGDFTVGSDDIKDAQAGDPRWIK